MKDAPEQSKLSYEPPRLTVHGDIRPITRMPGPPPNTGGPPWGGAGPPYGPPPFVFSDGV